MDKNGLSNNGKFVRLGIIGVGNMGTAHINNINSGQCPEVKVTAVADINPERIAWAKENLSDDALLFNHAEELLEKGKDIVDAVLIAVPHYDHPKYAIDAMRRGIHVMSEKPAGVYTKQVRIMNEAAEVAKADNIKFGMMFNQRTDHIYRKMREIVKSGILGRIKRTSWIITDWYRSQAYYNSGAWRATWSGEGGGVLLNQCPHNLDLWQWICGMPNKVEAKMHFGKWRDIEVEDDVSVYVEYPDGGTGTFITTTGDFPGSNRFEITLEGGKLLAEGGKLKMWKLGEMEPDFSKRNDVPFGSPAVEFSEVETDGESLQHIGVLNAFAGAILRDSPLIADGCEGINGLTLSNAMHLSAWTGRMVDIPFDEDFYYEELMKRVRGSRRKENIKSVTSDVEGTY